MADRFKSKYKQGKTNVVGYEVIVDTETGVNYLVATTSTGAVSVTPLFYLAKPLVTSIYEFKDK